MAKRLFRLAVLSIFFVTQAGAQAAAAYMCDSGCSGHGVCSATGGCACNHDYAGRDCGYFLGPASFLARDKSFASSDALSSTCSGGCSGQGACVAGACVCQAGFFGPSCADAECPGSCFGHGSCSHGTCLCTNDWMGQQCEMRAYPMLRELNHAQEEKESIVMPAPAAAETVFAQQFAMPSQEVHAPESVFQTASQANKEAWGVADELYAAAKRENERDADHRMERALASAHQNWEKLPGHEFGPKPATAGDTDVALLSEHAEVRSSACRSGCSGHGTCNGETGQCACKKSWVGASCDQPRCPSDCAGRGMCISGQCLCNPQRFGQSCQHVRCPSDCSGNGYCFNGKCQCSGNYGGEACLMQIHSSAVVRFKMAKGAPSKPGVPHPLASLRASELSPGSQASLLSWQAGSSANEAEQAGCQAGCNNRGSCVRGQCLCYAGFQGHDCSQTGACHAHGTPVTSLLSVQGEHTRCKCDAGWSGADCNVELMCADQTCSGHGICSYGTCTCGLGFSGHSCHISLISCEYRCGSHGSCSTADTDSACSCHDGWTGSRCHIAKLQCQNNCNARGTCMSGVCSCNAPFEGSACERLSSLVTGNETQAAPRPAILLGMQKSSSGAKSSSAELQNSTAEKKTSNTISTPMTASWLQPSALIRAASNEARVPLLAAKVAAASEEAAWHPAIVPPGTAGSVLSLLSSRLKSASESPWKEQPLAEQPREAALPKKLIPLLALSPKAPSLLSAANDQKDSSQSSDLDALLSDI